ncbi:hypothetical protein I3760_03G194700 [Carya illinoinensis]|nr:hypothetical protein I3760_03G194700 [Carya illinoinensis]
MADSDDPNTSGDTSNLSDSILELTTRMTEVLNNTQTSTITTETPISPIGIKLDGSNYALWSQVVEMYISGKDKLRYINRDFRQSPPSDPSFRKWRTNNAIVKGWSITSMDLSLIGNFIRFPTTKVVWDSIATTFFDGSDTSQVYDLRRPRKCPDGIDTSGSSGTTVVAAAEPHLSLILPAAMSTGTPPNLNSSISGLALLTSRRDAACSAWLLNSGATNHMTFAASDFSQTSLPCRTSIANANGVISPVTGIGPMTLSPSLHLSNTLLVLSLSHKLLSVSQLTADLRCVVLIYPNFCLIQGILTKEIIGRGTKRRELYYVDDISIGQANNMNNLHTNKETLLWLWHRRLGHPSFPYLKHILPNLFKHL